MDLIITAYQVGERPAVSLPDHEFYTVLGETGIRNLVSKHYDLLRESELKGLFPTDDTAFQASKRNSADFMIFITGGPDYYNPRRGKPRLINRHSHFSVTPEGRVIWLNCFKQALMSVNAPEHLIISFWNYLNVFSSWMVNSESVSNPQ